MQEPNWKSLVRELVEKHNKEMGAAVLIRPPKSMDKTEFVQTLPDDSNLTFEGPKIKAKMIRGWLWEMRESRYVNRPGAFVFSFYSEETDTSHVGIGAHASPTAAVRLTELREQIA